MRNETQDERRTFGWTLPTSLVLHALIAAFLILGLPKSLPKPQEDEAVNVELVKPPEKPKPEPPPPPPPKPEKPPEKVEKPADKETVQPAPPPTMQRVFRFGDKDSGPRQALDGNSVEEGAAAPTAPDDPDKKEVTKQQAPAELEAKHGGVPAPAPEKTAPSKPADDVKELKETKLTEAKRLFSRSITGDPVAMSAMAGLPRAVRAGQLCSSELGQQLLNGTPSYYPERVPLYPLDSGTVLDEPEAAFPANRGWYNVSFRCEIDEDATRVVSFAFRVGDPIPRSDWKRRGLPDLYVLLDGE